MNMQNRQRKERAPKKLLQVKLAPEAYTRLVVLAAYEGRNPGDVVSDLALRHLPAILLQQQTA